MILRVVARHIWDFYRIFQTQRRCTEQKAVKKRDFIAIQLYSYIITRVFKGTKVRVPLIFS